MHLPHPHLILPVAAACWLAAGLWQGAPSPPHHDGPEVNNPFAIRQSAYGRMAARLMKDSLHCYWHGGKCAKQAGKCTGAPPSPAGRLARRTTPPPAPVEPPAPVRASWLERSTQKLAELDSNRTVRNSPYTPGEAHRRYLAASADWRVHLAWRLDPCDAALYEIGHFTILSKSATPEAAKQASGALAQRTIMQALSPQSGPADVLTGAGAAINLLNEQLQPGRPHTDTPKLLHDWRVLNLCLNRHRELRREADEQDWWGGIPEARRHEIESYATLLERISSTIAMQMSSKGLLRQP